MEDDQSVEIKALIAFDTQPKNISRREHSHPAAYALLHESTNSIYIGSTSNLYRRLSNHKTDLRRGVHKNDNLQQAFNCDERFSLSFVKTDDHAAALKIEQQALDVLMSDGRLLNISPDAVFANKGVKLDDERKEQIRQRTIQQFSTEEARNRHREISLNQWADPAYRARFNEGSSKVDMAAKAEKIAATVKSMWDDPDYRAHQVKHLHERRRPVVVCGVEYSSVKDAIIGTGLPASTVNSRLSRGHPDYHYVDNGEKNEP